ncbi:MAG: RNA polymerase sigma factor RpoD/SigA, partial [Planctomycetaceae bacterium]|nr:RNA polymerase sigma factor RpoD/SigA [Planctomycetaceae bacterium]
MAGVQSPLETYLREIGATALLTPDEEQELSQAVVT